MEKIRSLSQLIIDLKDGFTGERVTIDHILEGFHERGFGFLLFVFALPPALPFPAPGLGTIVAPALFFLTLQQIAGRHTVWLPGRVRRMSFDRKTISSLLDQGIPWIRRIEILARPRFGNLTRGFPSRLIGVAGFIMSLSIMLPIPLTNTVPGVGIVLMSVGVMMRDGLSVVAGAIIGLGWIAMTVVVVTFFGTEAVTMLRNLF